MGSACAKLRDCAERSARSDRRRSSLMMFATNGKPPTWLWFLFLVFGSSLGIWLQWKERQAKWNAIDREIHHGIAKGIAHQKKRGRIPRKFFT